MGIPMRGADVSPTVARSRGASACRRRV